MQVFLAYGFSRATMDDIARAVEISRPALYLLFRNKADIFRAVEQDLLDQSHAMACEVLRGDEPLSERLMKALDRAVFRLLTSIIDSPHGDELVDFNNHIAADLVTAWRRRMVDSFARAIADEAALRGARLETQGLSAQGLAEMLFDVLSGLKARGRRGQQAAPHVREFITLVELALNHR
ncbi:TetR/AcrR family transcriptional regulator [Chelativorans sp. AA-79]|uniref:TetR/AcrR family transcriptional regulator n=1 Tax=Chelativorans sp. AA-79 TaxID=3028735 RepID=UPI0023F67D20|nr:TetR/AcrR family transcriptional regulator [Chelativorans sp. AA-79]WEX09723.1 helix-turn-helix domain containing protein [Chelativorans sp. AA-79]